MTDPTELYALAISACTQGNWQRAHELAVRLVQISPDHGGVCYIAGVASMELHQLPQAVEYLRRAVRLDPARANFATLYAKALSLAGLSDEAVLAADHAAALSPSDPTLLVTLGMIYALAKAHARAATLFRRTIVLMPTHAACRYHLAMALVFLGDLDAAAQELDACLALDPAFWKAHLSLALLRQQTSASNHVERLQALLMEIDGDTPDTDALVCLNMALAKEYEDLADYPQAFAHLVRGKSAGGAGRNYSIRRDEALFAAIADAFPEPRVTAAGYPTDEPIFIIGMPRSGTTLVERIISSHPDVHSAGELLNFGMALKQASGSRTPVLLDPDTIARSRHVDWKQLGETYLSGTRPATGHTPRFIDKLPLNFLYAGYIANALPNAKIICLRRDPMDTCLSNFRQLFAAESPYFDYSFDLLDTGRYYVLFDHLMGHWQRIFPGRILEVDYETLVGSQETSSRRLLEFCDLSWHDACLHFEDNPMPVATASAVQVRAPIYRSALKRWRKYGPQLGELQKLLISAGISIAE